MDKDQLKFDMFVESLRLGTKGMLAGALSVNVAYLIATNAVSSGDAKIPISGFAIPDKETAIILFMVIYFLSGLFTLFAVARAEHLATQIDDGEIQKIAVMHPSLFSASFPVRWIALIVLQAASWIVFEEAFTFPIWAVALLGTGCASPFGIAFQFGKGIRHLG